MSTDGVIHLESQETAQKTAKVPSVWSGFPYVIKIMIIKIENQFRWFGLILISENVKVLSEGRKHPL